MVKMLKPAVKTLESRVRRIQVASWRAAGASSTERGYDHRWRKERAEYLRLHPACVMCEAEGKVRAANVVDHVVPHRGDMALFWDKTNWQSLCRPHHDSHKQRMERELESGSEPGPAVKPRRRGGSFGMA